MIKVERGTSPPTLNSVEVINALERGRSHVAAGGLRGTQQRFSVEDEIRTIGGEDLLRALVAQFDGRCAYTELPIPEPALDNALLHRPSRNASDLLGEPSPDHYWWLAGSWTNWYLASALVQEVKGSQFPVIGDRSKKGDAVDQGLFLDPCVDHPEWYLRFMPDGSVEARLHPSARERDAYGPQDRGAFNIAALGLNSGELVSSRRLAVASFMMDGDHVAWDVDTDAHVGAQRQVAARTVLEFATEHGPAETKAHFSTWLDTLTPELAALICSERQLLGRGAERLGPVIRAAITDHVRRLFPDVAPQLDAIFDPRFVSPRPDILGGPAPMTAPTPTGDPIPSTAQRAPIIERVVIKNFKAIRNAEFSMHPGDVIVGSGPGEDDIRVLGAKTFLGENGSGKSSILEAVSFALAGQELTPVMAGLGLEWRKFLRRTSDPENDPVRQGRVLVTFRDQSRIDLRFNHHKHWFVGPDPTVDFFVRAYGATRSLPPLEGEEGDVQTAAAQKIRIANMFDPRSTVLDAESWLLSLPDESFNLAATQIAELISYRTRWETGARPGAVLTRNDDRSEVRVHGDSLDSVSDGYGAIVSLMCDIMAGAASSDLSDLRNASGIVLIDEIGAHLHPSWRMFVTRLLRRAFPQMQFLTSTHEPLCLRGLFRGEVVLVQRDVDREVVLEEIDRSPSDYRVDQLLTSEFFGLQTTVDPDEDRKLQAYYRLLALPEHQRPPNYETQLVLFKPSFESQALGHSRRDQLAYEAIDTYLAARDTSTLAERRTQRDEAFRKIADIWERFGKDMKKLRRPIDEGSP